ncbi:anthranilate phosphoribosyltransferase [Sulfobacillus thermosulfidooxidans]|uniref:anthranilate phosphoribosyltransferase n=1 Tax=Sulfobacillus thermosulfidooxidans TaxID=28034 RepID=UPI00096B981F|nr:anthranilate phosphoribosyltransferase [Sulfobacillus thermosulfidooxidans]OLZ09728.1 anthranilate phosphoribosyltransferase [Sulfobacillus thermosulfidooxidans]OLZ15965.1 anthranilate phosphoribosyltransferase [Sulfobacillus thermosulfidooxidans]OLZ18187.1 anthranilate phosphoribosyltransferase [Sulfobacillus thermosulfidooxidans]
MNTEEELIRHDLMRLSQGDKLNEEEAYALMDAMMNGAATPVQVAGILMALAVRGETVDELTGFARAMRDHATPIVLANRPVLDTCGTGGDRSFTFNVSTVSAFVVAASGVHVAKHGNRSATSKSGSADLLEALGIRITQNPAEVARFVDEIGFGFLFAQQIHTSMRYAAQTRKELGVRTVFNLLGPLTNPVHPEYQLLGVFGEQWVKPITEVLSRLKLQRAVVVHGAGGLDEVSLAGPTIFGIADSEGIRYGQWMPEDLGLPTYPKEAFRGGDPAENAQICYQVLRGEEGPYLDMVLANAGVGLYAAGAVQTPREGVDMAREAIQTGQAARIVDELISQSQHQEQQEA